jgi:hypothetical protein
VTVTAAVPAPPAAGAAAGPASLAEPAEATPTPLAGSDVPLAREALVEALLRRVHDERAPIGAMLEQAAWIEEDGGTLRIAYGETHGFFRDKVQSREVADYIRRVARELGGRDLRLEVATSAARVMAPAAGAVAAPGSTARMPRRVTDSVMSDRGGPPPGPAAGAAPRAAAAIQDDPHRRALLDQALTEPSLRSVLDLFGGEIVDIEPV